MRITNCGRGVHRREVVGVEKLQSLPPHWYTLRFSKKVKALMRPEDPRVEGAIGLEHYADVLRELGREAEAAEVETRAEATWHKIIAIHRGTLSPDHVHLAMDFNNLANLQGCPTW